MEQVDGDSELSQERREIKIASVVKNISQNFTNLTTLLWGIRVTYETTYNGENEHKDAVELFNKLDNLQFKPGLSQIRWVHFRVRLDNNQRVPTENAAHFLMR